MALREPLICSPSTSDTVIYTSFLVFSQKVPCRMPRKCCESQPNYAFCPFPAAKSRKTCRKTRQQEWTALPTQGLTEIIVTNAGKEPIWQCWSSPPAMIGAHSQLAERQQNSRLRRSNIAGAIRSLCSFRCSLHSVSAESHCQAGSLPVF